MANDYEDLKKQGYTEEELKKDLDNANYMEVSPSRATDWPDVRNVHVKAIDGTMKQTTNRSFSKKSKIDFPNGKYISEEELKKALSDYAEIDQENQVFACKKTGKLLSSLDEVVDEVFEMSKDSAKMIVGDQSPKIHNQEAPVVSVKGKNSDQIIRNGILMLGNGKVKLPSGDYINYDDLEKALSEYVLMTKDEKEVPVVIPIDEGEKVGPVPIKTPPKKETHEYKKKNYRFHLWPIILAAVILFVSGFKYKRGNDAQYAEQLIKQASFSVSELSLDEQGTLEKAIEDLNITTGEPTYVAPGVTYYESSDYQFGGRDKEGTFGVTEGRPSGEYTIDYFSIINDEEIDKVVYEQGKELDTVLEEYCEKTNSDLNDLIIMVHIGGPVSGWVNLYDLIDQRQNELGDIDLVLDEKESFSGVDDNFNGTITFDTENGPVTLNLLDENGNYIKESSIVEGSDGEKYRLSKLDVNEETKTIETSPETKGKLTWSVHNISKEEALLAAAVAATAAIPRKEEEKEEQQSLNASNTASSMAR